MLFPTSHYRLAARINTPTILKRPSLRVTSLFQSHWEAVMQPIFLLWAVFIAALLAWVGAYYEALSLLG
jgi:hypothetical protein